jgi:hypothetical protein
VQSFPDASLGVSVAVDGQIFQTDYTRHHIRPRNILVPASYRDGLHSGVGGRDGDEEGDVVGDGDAGAGKETRKDEEEDSSDDFFDAGEGPLIGDRISLCAASESGQSGGGTEDDPLGPVTPSPGQRHHPAWY